MEQSHGNKKAKLIAWLVVIAAVVLIYTFVSARSSNEDASSSSNDGITMPVDDTSRQSAASNSAVYEDGIYTASSSYNSPGGIEDITVSITLKDGVVADSSVKQEPNEPQAEHYQAEFRENYKPRVIGKKLDDISLSRVSGSSLTSEGFNKAIEKIKNQAESES